MAERNSMLLLKTKRSFQEIMAGVFSTLVILPATKTGETRDASKARANDLAVTARIAGVGAFVIESAKGELFVMGSDNESQCVGFARKMLKESRIAEPWFILLYDDKGLLYLETADRQRKTGKLTDIGFVLPDGLIIEIVANYTPAQNNTALLFHRKLISIPESERL